eukprot:TRINITY_DN745_c0_g7_i1.p1 TRINITY_DN745_c0_g7~~TRINITY_DN745_c0_g7_i1.p1  ORF type:complete len:322 (-),score=34.76 TRINITY_DN745_c0_g7_i1:159-1124(-)
MSSNLLNHYEGIVLKNMDSVGYFESSLRAILFFLIGRHRESELSTELAYSTIGLVSLYHDWILLKHFQSRFQEFTNQKNGKFCQLRVGLPLANTSYALSISAIKQVELTLEIFAKHRLGERAQHYAVVMIEAMKALLRLILFFKNHQTLLVHQTIPPRETYPPPQTFIDEKDKSQANSPTLLREREALLKLMVTNKLQPTPLPPNKILGELLYILRPLIYVTLMFRYSRKSWSPWLVSLICDMTSRTLLSDNIKLNEVEQGEISRRASLLAFYLLRSPLYETLTQSSFAQSFSFVHSVPLLGAVCEYVHTYRDYYFFSSGS